MDSTELTCCVLPYGTGNDFARVCGWGGDYTAPCLKNPETLIEEVVMKCKAEKFDVWQVEIKPREKDGDILIVDSKTRKYVSMPFNGPVYKRFMLNYMGFGNDARIGAAVEKKRTNNKCCNDFYYVWEAVKKACCLKNLDPNSRLEYLAVLDE